MQISAYLNLIDSITVSGLICKACGASVYTFSTQRETFCNFCEAHVTRDDLNIIHASVANEKNLAGMQNAAKSGEWASGIPYADALAATKDPSFLYGAAMFYRFFSDLVYNDVNYEQGGFMYSNADKRSDEVQRNKYNSMALISKSKEHLFRILKITDSGQNPDASGLYLKFLANIRLKRYSQAAETLVSLESASPNSALSRYAAMAFAADSLSEGQKMSKPPQADNASGSANFFYYISKYLAYHGDLTGAISVLDKLTKRSFTPIAFYYKERVVDVNAAAGF